ncbi:MAG: FAD-dependent oxidoreductase [Planctomycetota bacterium]|nr:FAD-dependent oxidoreductase [Planctomycetota bacterium]
MHVVVLGAGLAGLATAYELLKAGHRVTVVEKESYLGGMASSWKVGPYWLDHGPHRFHSRDKELIEHLYEILDNDVVIRERLSRIYMRGRFFHYPLKTQNVLQNMPKLLLARAMWDYLWIRLKEAVRPTPDDNFENWVLKRFGRTLYDMFFGTYTSKAWKMPCTEISADWASQRISQANLWDAIKKTLRPPKDGEVRSLVSEFWYPGHGGIGSIGRKYGEKVSAMGAEMHMESLLERLEVADGKVRRVVWKHGGEEHAVGCDQVVNTVPLPRLLEAFDPAIDQDVRDAIARLRYIGIVFVYIEVDRATVSPDHWVYLPEKHLTIHRISEFKNFSDDAAPGDSTVVCCEITCRWDDEHWNLTLEEGAEIAIHDLRTVGLLSADVGARGIDMHKLRYAYPVYDLTYKQNLDVLKRAAKAIGNLHTTGRQGLYRYNNMDHSIAMGRRVAKTIAKGVDAKAEEVAAGKEHFG